MHNKCPGVIPRHSLLVKVSGIETLSKPCSISISERVTDSDVGSGIYRACKGISAWQETCPHVDFRPKGQFSTFGTELLLPACLQRSVPKALFRRLGRNFYSLHASRVPSRRPFFIVWDGTFMACACSGKHLTVLNTGPAPRPV